MGIFACLLQGIWDICYPPIQASKKKVAFKDFSTKKYGQYFSDLTIKTFVGFLNGSILTRCFQ